MNIRLIESVIDSIDPYRLSNDLGLKVYKEINSRAANTYPEKAKYNSDLFYVSFDKGSSKEEKIRLTRDGGFVTLNPIDAIANNKFIAGSGIDLIAYYMNGGDYDKAFKLYFSHYGAYIKKRLMHEPAYIEQIIKDFYVKRNNVLKVIVEKLYNNKNSAATSKSYEAEMWLNKYVGDEAANTSKGVFFIDDCQSIANLLLFLFENQITKFDKDRIIDFTNGKVRYDIANTYNGFLDDVILGGFNEKIGRYNEPVKNWIVMPTFVNYYKLNGLKFIDPVNNRSYYLKLNNHVISYGGLFGGVNLNICQNEDKVRVLDDYREMLVCNHHKSKLRLKHLNYLYLEVDNTADSYENITFNNVLYLFNNQKSGFYALKTFADSVVGCGGKFGVVEFNNFKESNVVYSYKSFLEKSFKETVIAERGVLTPKLLGMIAMLDITDLEFKKSLCNWLKSDAGNSFNDVYDKLNEVASESINFRSFRMTVTKNGYVCSDRPQSKASSYSTSSSSTSLLDSVIVTNFIIKVDYNVIFNETDNILHVGRLILSGGAGNEENKNNINEYPLKFYKSELLKKDAVEKIAMKAYMAAVNRDAFDIDMSGSSVSGMSLMDGGNSLSARVAPVVFDKSYNNALVTIINNEINRASYRTGVLNLGWYGGSMGNKNVFNSVSWFVNRLGMVKRNQTIYSLDPSNNKVPTELISVFNTSSYIDDKNMPDILDEDYIKSKLNFLNIYIKNVLSIMLAWFYRLYMGYEVKPVVVLDSVNARNMLNFIFAALGQVRPYEIINNERFIKSGAGIKNMTSSQSLSKKSKDNIADGLNNYPILARFNLKRAYSDKKPSFLKSKKSNAAEESLSSNANVETLLKYVDDYPYFLLSEPIMSNNEKESEDDDDLIDMLSINCNITDDLFNDNNKSSSQEQKGIQKQLEVYQYLTAFSFKTFTKFFKRLLNDNKVIDDGKYETVVRDQRIANVLLSENDIKNNVSNLKQLLEEGNRLFDDVWGNDSPYVLEICKREMQYWSSFKELIGMMTLEEIKKCFNYNKKHDCVVIKRASVPERLKLLMSKNYVHLKQYNKIKKLKTKDNLKIYDMLDLNLCKNIFKDAFTKDKQLIDIEKDLDIFLSDEERSDEIKTDFNRIARSVTSDEYRQNILKLQKKVL